MKNHITLLFAACLLISIAAPTPAASTDPNRKPSESNSVRADRTQGDWGTSVEGLQCRLRPLKSQWRSDQIPILYLDLRNKGEYKFDYIDNMSAHCNIEIDGNSYGDAEKPQRIRGRLEYLYPGFEKLDVFTIPLTSDWGEHFNLYLGKHIVLVRFRPFDLEGRSNKLWVVSNAVVVEILPRGKSAAPPEPNSVSAQQCMKRVEDIVAKIKPGSTQSSIEKYFDLDGSSGFFDENHIIYCFKECRDIKIDVRFHRFDPNALARRAGHRTDMVVLSVSKPCK